MTLQLNRMGSTWNRQERININDNWDMIEQNFNGVVNKTVKQAYEEIIDTVLQESVWNWKAPVQTYDDIFTTYQNPETGDTTIVLDDGDKTGNVYRFKDGEWQFVFKINPDIYLQLQDEINQTNNNLTQLEQTVNERLADIENKLELNILDFGAVGDGTTDNTQAFVDALNLANGRRIKIPRGVFKVNSEISYSGEVNIVGEGNSSVIDLSGGGNFLFSSQPVQIARTSSTIEAGDNSVTFASNHGLQSGDVFAIYNTQDYSWASYRPYYRDGCMFRVDEVVSSTALRTFGVSPSSYPVDNHLTYKLTGKGVVLKDIKIVPNNTKSVLVLIDGHVGVRLSGLTLPKGGSYTGFEIWRCFDVDIEDITAEIFSGDSYPISISNSQKVTVTRCSLYSSRHAIALGGRTGDACVPTRDVLIDHCHLWNRSNSGVGSADMHGIVENVVYSNCYMNTAVNMAGRNVSYTNCTIVGRNPKAYADGSCIYGSEIVGGVYRIENCRLITYGNGASFGIVHLNVASREDDLKVLIKNNILENKGDFTTLRAVTLDAGSDGSSNTIDRIDVTIDGMEFNSSKSIFGVLYFPSTTNISNIASCIVDNINAPSGTHLVVASNSQNYNMPMRLQTQSGKQQITASSDTSYTLGSAQSFKYIYPRMPVAHVSVGSNTSKLYNGNRAIYAGINRVRVNDITPFIESGDGENWTSTADTYVMWTVGINEV